MFSYLTILVRESETVVSGDPDSKHLTWGFEDKLHKMQRNLTLGGTRHNTKNEEETHNEISKILKAIFRRKFNP